MGNSISCQKLPYFPLFATKYSVLFYHFFTNRTLVRSAPPSAAYNITKGGDEHDETAKLCGCTVFRAYEQGAYAKTDGRCCRAIVAAISGSGTRKSGSEALNGNSTGGFFRHPIGQAERWGTDTCGAHTPRVGSGACMRMVYIEPTVCAVFTRIAVEKSWFACFMM